jgi:hypothetical protein
MKPNLVLASAFLLFCYSAIARDPQWFQRRMSELDMVLNNTNEVEKTAGLGKFIGIGRYGPNSMDEEQRTLFDKAQSSLLAIPGHAKYYQEKIEEKRAFAKYYHGLSDEEQRKIEDEFREKQQNITEALDYNGMRQDAFDIFALLPSPETVAVLGYYLEDPEGRDGKNLLGHPIVVPGSDVAPGTPNCGKAFMALGKLGIEHPPAPLTPLENSLQYHERVDVWKQWWNEIKAGKRTYRFKGSPIEYGPDGPATPEQIEKARATRERDEKRATGHARRTDKEEGSENEPDANERSRPLFMLIAAAVAVLVSIAWYYRRYRAAR